MKNKILEAYNEYSFKEFGSETLETLPSVLSLAYTTTESEKHEVQVNYNVDLEQYEEYIDMELKHVNKCPLEAFLIDIEIGSFDGFVSDILSEAEEMEEKEEAFKEAVKHYRNNYKEYIELVIAMELGSDCNYFKMSEEEKEEAYQYYMSCNSSVFDVELLDKCFN